MKTPAITKSYLIKLKFKRAYFKHLIIDKEDLETFRLKPLFSHILFLHISETS